MGFFFIYLRALRICSPEHLADEEKDINNIFFK